MIDIIGAPQGRDLEIYDTQTQKAKNVLSIQLGSLEYIPEFGIDMEYFLTESFKFQNDSFKAYCVEILADNGINVASVMETVEPLFTQMIFNITADENSTGMIAR